MSCESCEFEYFHGEMYHEYDCPVAKLDREAKIMKLDSGTYAFTLWGNTGDWRFLPVGSSRDLTAFWEFIDWVEEVFPAVDCKHDGASVMIKAWD